MKKLIDENISEVMCSDMPDSSEFSAVIYHSQDVGRLMSTDFKTSQESSNLAWSEMYSVMSHCIARGMRLEREKHQQETRCEK
jgi:hypothetical protein